MKYPAGELSVVKVWNNLLKLFLRRLSSRLLEATPNTYRMCVRMMRKFNGRVFRFRWLQRLVNHLLPCPQMVQRYIDPALGIEKFCSILNTRGVRYVILRWFENLPDLTNDDDVDMLVHDDDLPKIKDLFVVLPTGTPCDIYSVSPLPGASYRNGVPLYPSHLARQILETSAMYKDTYRVPDPKRHFLSLAYHAAYHKAEQAGLPCSKDGAEATVKCARSYSEKLVALGKACGVKVSPDLRSLHELLTECGWAPRFDVLRRSAKGSEWLSSLVARGSSGQPVSSSTIRYAFDVYGVQVLIESNCATFMEYIRRDFCFFHDPKGDVSPPHVHVNFLNKTPPWEEIPLHAVPLFKTAASAVYKSGPNRYIDHNREVFAIYDLKRDEGTVYSDDPDAMYRIAYSILMTRIGFRLDRTRLHRMHALGISVDNTALLFLGDGGCGKTTLGLEMMKHPQVGWLTDDILPVDSTGRALAFPTSPRLIQGSVVPWLPPSVVLLKAPMPKEPPKVQLPSSSLLSRVCSSAKLRALFLCNRTPGLRPSINRVGFLEAFRGICNNALTGKEFGHMMAYHLQFSPVYLYRMAALYLSRLRTFCYFAWTVPVLRFHMSGEISENASMVLKRFSATRRDDLARTANSLSDIPSVGADG
jgi:hypothetical protein